MIPSVAAQRILRRSETFEWSLKVTSGSTCGCNGLKKEVVRGLGAVTWSW